MAGQATRPSRKGCAAAAAALSAAGLLAALLAVLLAVQPAGGAFRGTNGKIFFSRSVAGGKTFSMNADGSGQTQLTSSAFEDEDPAVSPNGARVAFGRFEAGQSEIYTMNADGSGATRLTNNAADDTDPAWSPDGSKIAFISARASPLEIYTMNADGTNQTRLTSNAAADEDPAWSPDGTKIAFASDRTGGQYDIFTMSTDGTNQTALITASNADRDPNWSPDGTRIAFDSFRDGNMEIYTASSADGGGLTRLTSNAVSDGRPSYSPDGTRIAFDTDRDGNSEIYAMNTDGSSPTRLTSNSDFDFNADWQTTNTGPTAAFTIAPNPATAGQAVSFDGSTSSDPDGSIASYKWDLDGDGGFETDTGRTATASRTYTAAGTPTVSLKVTDDKGATGTASHAVTINAAAPSETPIATQTTVAMPDVTKLKADVAREKVFAAGIHADLRFEYSNSKPPAGVGVGAVAAQEPAAGQQVQSSVDRLAAVALTVYAGPKVDPKGGCEEAGVLEKALKSVDLDIGNQILQKAGLSLEKDVQLVFGKPALAPEIASFDQRGDSCRGEVDYRVPATQRAQDLFFVLAPRARRLTFGEDWHLTAGAPNFFTLSVVDRAGHVLNGAAVELDVSDLGGKDARGRTSAVGKTAIKATPRRAGKLDLLASATAGDGRTIYGVTRLAVEKRGGGAFQTFLGERFKRAGGGFKFSGGAKGKLSDEAKKACTAFKATTGQAACPSGFLRGMAVLVLDNERPPSDDIGVAKVGTSEGVELRPGQSAVFAKQGIEMTDLILPAASAAQAKAGFTRNAWAGTGPVAADFAGRIPAASAAAARKAGESIATPAPHLAPSLPLAHTVLAGPAGPPSFDGGAVKAGLGAGQKSCDFGTVIASKYAPTFLNPFRKYCV